MPTSSTPLPPDADGLPTTPEARAEYVRAAVEQRKTVALQTLFKAELLASPVFAAEMASYNPRSFDSFADSYASYKMQTYLQGPQALENQEERFLEFRRDAAEHLWAVQQKKLFDLQCQWRAEQLTLPGIRHTHDFLAWEKYIDYCSLVPPITADEVDLYEAYLRSDDFDPEQIHGWQRYDDFKRDEDPDQPNDFSTDELPAWYAFHNARTGAGALLSLTDRRTPKEERYTDLWSDELKETRDAAAETASETEKLPWPPSCIGLDVIGAFFDRFEPAADLPRLHRWRRAAEREQNRSSWELEQAEYWYTCVLHPAAEAWPIQAHADWRVALRKAGYDYWRTQMANVLHEVWQEQEQSRALGLPLTPPYNARYRTPFDAQNWDEDTHWYTKAILRGRELAGEPRDFDF